jgi:ABC-type branched-subunit amino acid transport system substrate-binding protein
MPPSRLTACFLIILLVPALLAAAPLTPQEQRGKQIFVEGTTPSGGEITAVMGEQGIEVPAATVPCASCHGRDGRGKPEGGVTPTDLTWSSLTRPYGVTHPSGRRHPPYDEKLLKRAVTMGLDPAGNALHVAMPRFRLSLEAMADLTAYIKRLGTESDPGVSDTALRVGLVLPPPGPLTPMGKAVQAALGARLADWNEKGGIYGRNVELVPLEPPADPAARRAAVAGFLDSGGVFAALAAFLLGDDVPLADLFGAKETPLVGPFTVHPRETFPLNREVFYLLPGVEAQAQALVRAARAVAGPAHPALLAPDDADLDDAVKALASAAAGTPAWPAARTERYPRAAFDPEATARRLAAAAADPVFFLGSGTEALALLRAADRLGWHPRLMAAATAGDGSLLQVPKSFEGRLFLALPAPPRVPGEAESAYRALAAAHPLPANDLSAQLTALAAAEILGEALKRAGRDITRDRLIEQLETLRTFETGYAPPVTYGPARRLGARGAWVLTLDLAGQGVASAEWVGVE